MSRPFSLLARSRPAGAPPLSAPDPSPGSRGSGPRGALRGLAVPAVSVVIYFAVRPLAGSDAAGLAIAGAIPAAYTIIVALVRRRVEPWPALAAVGYALACVASLLAGGNSLPLKLHEAAVTFVLGVVLLGAALAGRPLPVGRVLKTPGLDRAREAALSMLVGGFLVLHSLLQLALALLLSTAAYLTVGHAVGWATLAAGALSLYAYLRRLRRDPAKSQSGASDSSGGEPGSRRGHA